MDDDVVALLALHARSKGLIPRGLDTDLWRSYLNGDALGGGHWLLACEANVQGWLEPSTGADYLTGNRNFAALRQHHVRFYDPNRTRAGDLPVELDPDPAWPDASLVI